MNLLNYQRRFQGDNFTEYSAAERLGYTRCLDDILSFLKEKTNFDPDKRMIDAVDLLTAIEETNEAINKEGERHAAFLSGQLSGINLGSKKVQEFMQENNLNSGSEDIPKELFTTGVSETEREIMKELENK